MLRTLTVDHCSLELPGWDVVFKKQIDLAKRAVFGLR